ncbi:MAG: DUF2064 domain-containing protein [bacterium]
MPVKNIAPSVIAICIQEPLEDGSTMDLGPIKGADLSRLHLGFVKDSVTHALRVNESDTRLYYIDSAERRKFVGSVLEFLGGKDGRGKAIPKSFSHHGMKKQRWGLRIEKVFSECFAAGYKNVLVIGSRTPTISPKMIKRALRMLKESDAVFGPTPEGRYYIIGMTGAPKIDLSAFNWKSPSIYSEVAAKFIEQGLAWSELEIWYTVESPEELELMARDINQYRFEDDEVTALETERTLEQILEKLGA